MRNLAYLLIVHAVFTASATSVAQRDGAGSAAFEGGSMPNHWSTGGPKCMEMPEWQVHEYNRDLYILRQSGCTNFEKPFVFLLFGRDEALLLDTGADSGNLAPTLQRTVHNWLKMNRRSQVTLIVAHTHSHSDHVAGDKGILALHDAAMPVTLVPATIADDSGFFHVRTWPEGTGQIDLGARVIDVIPTPGHAENGIALYDRRTAILFTGDSLYPGRLYVHNLAAFRASVERLVAFTRQRAVSHILGNHIEQTRTPFLDYPEGTIFQPDEHALELSRGSLLELQSALKDMQPSASRMALRDFTVWPVGTSDAENKIRQDLFLVTHDTQVSRMWDQDAAKP